MQHQAKPNVERDYRNLALFAIRSLTNDDRNDMYTTLVEVFPRLFSTGKADAYIDGSLLPRLLSDMFERYYWVLRSHPTTFNESIEAYNGIAKCDVARSELPYMFFMFQMFDSTFDYSQVSNFDTVRAGLEAVHQVSSMSTKDASMDSL